MRSEWTFLFIKENELTKKVNSTEGAVNFNMGAKKIIGVRKF